MWKTVHVSDIQITEFSQQSSMFIFTTFCCSLICTVATDYSLYDDNALKK